MTAVITLGFINFLLTSIGVLYDNVLLYKNEKKKTIIYSDVNLVSLEELVRNRVQIFLWSMSFVFISTDD